MFSFRKKKLPLGDIQFRAIRNVGGQNIIAAKYDFSSPPRGHTVDICASELWKNSSLEYPSTGVYFQMCNHMWSVIIDTFSSFLCQVILFLYTFAFSVDSACGGSQSGLNNTSGPALNLEQSFQGLSNLRMVIIGSISGSSAHEMLTRLSKV